MFLLILLLLLLYFNFVTRIVFDGKSLFHFNDIYIYVIRCFYILFIRSKLFSLQPFIVITTDRYYLMWYEEEGPGMPATIEPKDICEFLFSSPGRLAKK